MSTIKVVGPESPDDPLYENGHLADTIELQSVEKSSKTKRDIPNRSSKYAAGAAIEDNNLVEGHMSARETRRRLSKITPEQRLTPEQLKEERRKDKQLHEYLHSYFGDNEADEQQSQPSDKKVTFNDSWHKGHEANNNEPENVPTNGEIKVGGGPKGKWKDFLRRKSVVGNITRKKSTLSVYRNPRDELQHRGQEKLEMVVDGLAAGYPSILLMSTYFQEDENGHRKVPMLLSLLSLSISEVDPEKHHNNKHFKFHLEYGLGHHVLRWTIERDIRQLLIFHNKLKVQSIGHNYIANNSDRKELAIPKFPKLGRRESVGDLTPLGTYPASLASVSSQQLGVPAPNEASSVHSNVSSLESGSSVGSLVTNALHLVFNRHGTTEGYNLRDNLEEYFYQLLKALLMRPESTRLFRLFELSPMSVLLNQEGIKKRKEGSLFIKTTAKAQGWRVGHVRFIDFKAMVERHTSKWFIIAHNYVMYVADINSTTPLDVFLVDPSFRVTVSGFEGLYEAGNNLADFLKHHGEEEDYNTLGQQTDDDDDHIDEDGVDDDVKAARHFSLTMENSERRLSVVSRSARQIKDWCYSIFHMSVNSEWSEKHRFDSFAPIRDNCFAQWFVDARDYWWAASSAIEMAKDVIYIHDWWLSPELYLRRPANGNQEWRIDRLLKRKAEQGVKIFIIVYRNVINTVITDSLWTKHSLLDLHPNIHVMRSPNQWMQNVYFWAHHEKLLIVDQSVCFLGGVDLCYGRYDTPDHVIVDDSPYKFESDVPPEVLAKNTNLKYQVFAGKDYSNPRVSDFYNLNQPFEDMYDRQITPRMPWHDVHMVTCGQIARDLSRHFAQRWNYLLRQKRPSRPTPLLLPPRNFTPEELEQLNFNGTCEIQLLRSSCDWSLGLKQHEQSIENAYVKVIETSEHFIYIENQFFVTSCEVDGVIVVNRIGDALVDRIIRAHKNHETWKAVIVIPLLPGFASDVGRSDGSSMRLITRCQYMSISMGNSSIFAKLQRVGIVPEDYIQFYSLRRWGTIGKHEMLVTEQLYIHAKVMVADDRTAIIGSANINERSMRGTRDSEVCAIVRDKDLIDSTMDGKSYKVGAFAHTLRMRLMREHLGVDVDLIDMVERRFAEIEAFASTDEGLQASTTTVKEDRKLSAMVELGTRYLLQEYDGTETYRSKLTKGSLGGRELTDKLLKSFTSIGNEAEPKNTLDDIPYIYCFNHRAGEENVGIRDKKPFSTDTRVTTNVHREEVAGFGEDQYQSKAYVSSKSKVNAFLQMASEMVTEDDPLPKYEDIQDFLADDENGSMPAAEFNEMRWTMLKRLYYMERWKSKVKAKADKTRAAHLTQVPSPDDTPQDPEVKKPKRPVTTLTDEEVNEIDTNVLPQKETSFIDPYGFEDPLDITFFEGTWMPQAIRNTTLFAMVFHEQPDDTVGTWNDYKLYMELKADFMAHQKLARGLYASNEDDEVVDETPVEPGQTGRTPREHFSSGSSSSDEAAASAKILSDEQNQDSQRRALRRAWMAELDRYRRGFNSSGTMIGDDDYRPNAIYDYESAKKLLNLIQGRLVKFPTRWLQTEIEGSNWFYKADKIPPIQIYN